MISTGALSEAIDIEALYSNVARVGDIKVDEGFLKERGISSWP